MRILVTGASGIIGRKLIAELNQGGYEYFLLVRDDHDGDNNRFRKGDLNDRPSLIKATENIDVIIHLAGLTHTNKPKLYYQINTEGTKNLLQAAQVNKAGRFIYISSRAAGLDGGAYALSKYLAEAAVKESRLDWLIFRPAEIYGAGANEPLAKLIRAIKKCYFVPIFGRGDYKLCPVWVDDVIGAIIFSLNKKSLSRKTYILAGPEEFSFNQVVDIISETLRIRRAKVHLPVSLMKFLAFIFFLLGKDYIVRDQIPRLLSKKSADIQPAKNDFGFNPLPLAMGIRKII